MKMFGILAVLALSGLVGCENSVVSPTLESRGIYGTVVDKQGKKLKQVKVKVTPVIVGLKKVSADTLPDSTVTQEDGTFHILVDAGTYNVQSDYGNGSLVSISQNVKVSDSGATVLVDTIKEPGKIHGKISLSASLKKALAKSSDDLSKGSCFIPRISPVYRADQNGICEIPIVPEGNYNVVFEYPKFLPANESLFVESGKTVSSDVNLTSDPDYGPPTPVLKELIYDTLSGTIKIVWNKVSVSDLLGYNVYRSSNNETSLLTLNKVSIKDTFFVDSIYKLPSDSLTLNLVYTVKAQDSGLNVSENYSNSLKVSVNPPNKFKTYISFTTPSKVSVNDSVWVKVTCSNTFRKNVSIDWNIDSTLVSRAFDGVTDSILVSSKVAKTFKIKASVKDNFGYVWTNETSLEVKKFAPTINIPTQTLEADKLSEFSANATDDVGSIVKYEWDINGDGIFDTVTQTSKIFLTLDRPGKMIVTVTDDDGNIVSDTNSYQVFNYLNGNISKDLTLSKKAAPYLVNVVIDSGITLTVGPGVEIYLNGPRGWGIQVYGNLNLVGTEADSIHVHDFNGQSGIVYFKSSKNSISVMKYVHMNIEKYGLNSPIFKQIDFTHTFFDNTHLIIENKDLALGLVDPKNENRFVKMNIQYMGGTLEGL